VVFCKISAFTDAGGRQKYIDDLKPAFIEAKRRQGTVHGPMKKCAEATCKELCDSTVLLIPPTPSKDEHYIHFCCVEHAIQTMSLMKQGTWEAWINGKTSKGRPPSFPCAKKD
jgi:hypothetical protein